jgi:hypothetical protein
MALNNPILITSPYTIKVDVNGLPILSDVPIADAGTNVGAETGENR